MDLTPPITTKQFVCWLVVFTSGMVLWAMPGEILWPFGVGVLAMSNVIRMDKRERSRPLLVREILWTLVGVILFIALIFAAEIWSPGRVVAPFLDLLRRPLLVAFLWAVAAVFGYQSYRASQPIPP